MHNRLSWRALRRRQSNSKDTSRQNRLAASAAPPSDSPDFSGKMTNHIDNTEGGGFDGRGKAVVGDNSRSKENPKTGGKNTQQNTTKRHENFFPTPDATTLTTSSPTSTLTLSTTPQLIVPTQSLGPPGSHGIFATDDGGAEPTAATYPSPYGTPASTPTHGAHHSDIAGGAASVERPTTEDSTNSGLGTGPLAAAIAVPVFAVLAALALFLFLFARRRRRARASRQRHSEKLDDSSTNMLAPGYGTHHRDPTIRSTPDGLPHPSVSPSGYAASPPVRPLAQVQSPLASNGLAPGATTRSPYPPPPHPGTLTPLDPLAGSEPPPPYKEASPLSRAAPAQQQPQPPPAHPAQQPPPSGAHAEMFLYHGSADGRDRSRSPFADPTAAAVAHDNGDIEEEDENDEDDAVSDISETDGAHMAADQMSAVSDLSYQEELAGRPGQAM